MSASYLLISVVVFSLFGLIKLDRCAAEYRCLCLNDTISCVDEDIFVLPAFTSYEKRFIDTLNMRRTRLRTLPKMTHEDWPYLKVSVYFILQTIPVYIKGTKQFALFIHCFIMCIKIIISFLCLISNVLSTPCGDDGECSCNTYILNCQHTGLTSIPVFEKKQTINVVYFNLKDNFITVIDKAFLKSNWPNLQASNYFHTKPILFL